MTETSERTPPAPLNSEPERRRGGGVKGEFYPCRDDIFRQTYEAVPDHE